MKLLSSVIELSSQETAYFVAVEDSGSGMSGEFRKKQEEQMKAWVLHDVNDLRLEMVETPEIKENEVLVAVQAAGICGSDIPRVYQNGTYSFPLIPGHEFSGIVIKRGDAVDAEWQEERVGIFPLIPCKACLPCQKGQYEMCRNYSYLGSRRNGGFAEYAAVPAENLISLPDGVTFEEASMLEPLAVAVHAMRRIAPGPDDTVAVCGLGTIGLLLLMFLREAGFQKILTIGNKDFQKKMVLKLGLPEDSYCDSRRQDAGKWLMECTDGAGADVFFECVGKNETLTLGIEHTAPAGKVMLVGNPFSDMNLEKSVYWKILRNQLTVTGTWNSSFSNVLFQKKDLPEYKTYEEKEGYGYSREDDWHYVLRRLKQKRISPADLISYRLSLDELQQGGHIMRDKTEDYVKIVAQNICISA